MVKPICREEAFLRKKSTEAGSDDLGTARDLLDTLEYHKEHCLGMAANMIGVSKRIIAFRIGILAFPMLNPIIVKRSGAYEVEEGCLSLIGTRKVTRYQNIEVEFQDMKLEKHRQTFSGLVAEVIQHECNHLEGILI